MDPASQLFVPKSKRRGKGGGFAFTGDRYESAAYLGVGLYLVLVFLAPLLTYQDATTGDSSTALRQVGYVIALALTAFGLSGGKKTWSDFAVPIPVILTMLWCWLSISWAIDFDSSVKRMFLTTVVALTAFWSVRNMGYQKALTVLRGGLGILLVVNFLTVLFNPETGIHPPQDNKAYTIFGGMWRGIMAHKNFAGAACSLTFILFFFDSSDVNKWARRLALIGSLVFLYASQSKTSLGMAGIAIVAGYIFRVFSGRLRVILLTLFIVITSSAYIALQIYAEYIKDTILGPTAFTGRGHIWQALLAYSADHPWLGAGFGSFWNIGFNSPVYQYGTGFTTVVTVGHNGYLDLLITIGLPGLCLAVFSLMIWPLVRLMATAEVVHERAALIGALLVFGIGHNFTESSLYERDILVGVLLFFATAMATYCLSPVSRRSKVSVA